jgi:hypothetical protein
MSENSEQFIGNFAISSPVFNIIMEIVRTRLQQRSRNPQDIKPFDIKFFKTVKTGR